ncbi:hypothetical protein ACLOJK_036595 [Asimina triloba]
MSRPPIYKGGAARFSIGFTCGSYVVVAGQVRSMPAAHPRSAAHRPGCGVGRVCSMRVTCHSSATHRWGSGLVGFGDEALQHFS